MTAWIPIKGPRAGTLTKAIHGRFVERPHRFAARVELAGGEIVEAHVPNPGRLTGVLAPGCRVALEGPVPPPRTLRYTMLAARVERTWVGTVTTYANRVFPTLLEAGLFPELDVEGAAAGPEFARGEMPAGGGGGSTKPSAAPDARDAGARKAAAGEGGVKVNTGLAEGPGGTALRREVVHGRSRFDFEIGGRFVEVKSVSLASGVAGLFPDAVTARGARHCDELAALARGRRPTAIVFVAQRADVESVAPEDEIDPDFGRALRGAARAGVLVLACALDLTPRGARAARRVPMLL
jgi:sugar fermentation stimulation protein A